MVKLLMGNGRFDFEIVGESYRQDNLAALAGPKIPGGYQMDCLAALLFDDHNRHDRNAVGVHIVHENGRLTMAGYLARKVAPRYRKAVADTGGQSPEGMLCRAQIVGGWRESYEDAGQYGVKLDLKLPLKFGTVVAWENWKSRLLPWNE